MKGLETLVPIQSFRFTFHISFLNKNSARNTEESPQKNHAPRCLQTKAALKLCAPSDGSAATARLRVWSNTVLVLHPPTSTVTTGVTTSETPVCRGWIIQHFENKTQTPRRLQPWFHSKHLLFSLTAPIPFPPL